MFGSSGTFTAPDASYQLVIARRRKEPFAQVAKDFGIQESCDRWWVELAEVDDRARPGASSIEHAELPKAKKRIRLFQ